MTEPPAPERIAVIWSPEGRADLRAIDAHDKPMTDALPGLGSASGG